MSKDYSLLIHCKMSGTRLVN